MQKHWTIPLEDPNDGSGDLILSLPKDLLEIAGWKEGDTLIWNDNGDGSWSISKQVDD
jgi:hypothetical protein